MTLNNRNRQEINEIECAKPDKSAASGKLKNTSVDIKQSPTSTSTSLLQELIVQLLPPEGVSQIDDSNFTSFEFDTDEHLMLSVLYMTQDCPSVVRSKNEFMFAMSKAFDDANKIDKFDGV